MVRIEKRRGDGLATRLVGAPITLPESSLQTFAGRGVYRATPGWRPQPGLDALAPMHPRLRLIALALLLLAAFAPPADARYSSKKAIWGPTKVNGVSQFPIYRDLGVGIFQMQLSWNQVAPTRPTDPGDPADPAYRWPKEVDFAIRAGARSRIRVSLMLRGAPPWANGGRSSEWAPTHARDFGKFARAAARRYPGVHLWQIWGEPSRQNNFKPLPRFEATGPRRYARILDAAYAQPEAREPQEPRHRRQHLHHGRRQPAAIHSVDALAERPPPADGPVRPQPIHAPKARASTRARWVTATRISPTSTPSPGGSIGTSGGIAGGRSASSCRSSRSPPITRTTSSTSGSRGVSRPDGCPALCESLINGGGYTRSAGTRCTTKSRTVPAAGRETR